MPYWERGQILRTSLNSGMYIVVGGHFVNKSAYCDVEPWWRTHAKALHSVEWSQKKYWIPREKNNHRVTLLQRVDILKFTGHHLWGLPNKQNNCWRMLKTDRWVHAKKELFFHFFRASMRVPSHLFWYLAVCEVMLRSSLSIWRITQSSHLSRIRCG